MFLYNSNFPLYILLLSFTGLIVIRKNLINILIALELFFLALSFQAVLASLALNDMTGIIFAMFILAIAAAESAIGLALLIVYFRLRGLIFIDLIDNLKG